MASSVGRPFINKVFSENGNGYFKAESLGGEHIVQILSRTAPVKKSQSSGLCFGCQSQYRNSYRSL